MNVGFWVIQGVLALVFIMSGSMKLTRSKEQLAGQLPWVEDFSLPQIRVIGALELLGGVGLVLPALTGMMPWLTPLAAAGMVLVMIGASLTHYRRKEYSAIGGTAALFVLALLVVMGRFWIMPI